MSNRSDNSITDAEIVPTTVSGYVRAKLPEKLRWAFTWSLIAVPASAAVQASRDGWDFKAVGSAVIAIAAASILLGAISAVALFFGGLWETRRYRA